jgi:O-succinylbenzoic acid--CoA ligase
VSWLLERASRTPRGAAVVQDGRAVSWEALAQRVVALASGLRARGVVSGDVVALDADGLSFVEAFHAIDVCGAVLLPLNARLTPSEAAFPLREAGARLLLHAGPEAAARAARQTQVASVALDAVAARGAGGSAAPARAAGDAPLALVYTSGTTGTPRGAVLTRANFTASARASERHLGVTRGDRWLLCLPLFHVGGLSVLVRSALSGFPAVVQARFDADAVSRALEEEAITLVSLVPTMLERVLDVRGRRPAPPALRCVLLGGAAASDPLLARAAGRGVPVAPTYGLTEAASQVATCPLDRVRTPSGAGLAALDGVELRIADPSRGVGEIRVRGPMVMRGYRSRPAESAAALAGGWLHTGDLGALDSAGRLHVVGRRSDRIVSGGENVDPAEVEAVLSAHPAVREAAVAAVPDAGFGERPAAWLVPCQGELPADDELRRFCRERLAGYKVPVAFAVVGALPRNDSGKLLRRELPGLSPARRLAR